MEALRVAWLALVGVGAAVACSGGSSTGAGGAGNGPSGSSGGGSASSSGGASGNSSGGVSSGSGGGGGDASTSPDGSVPLNLVDVAASVGMPQLGTPCLGADDFDGDGKPDVVMVETSQDSLYALNVYLNTGNGFYKVVTSSWNLYQAIIYCTVGDVDGDGLPDLVGALAFQPYVYLLRNKGGGDLEVEQTIDLSGTPGFHGPGNMALADFNGDGSLDSVVGTFVPPPGKTQLDCATTPQGFACTVASPRCGAAPLVLANDGTGHFGTPASMDPTTTCGPEDANALAVVDYNGDGKADLFVADDFGVDALYQEGSTPMSFTDVSGNLGLKGYNHAMGAAFADYDLDGNLDLYVSDLGSSQFYLGTGGGALAWHGPDWGVAAATTYTSDWAALAEDFDSDGFTDIWVTNAAEVHDYTDLTTVGYGAPQLPPTENSDFLFHNRAGGAFDLLIVPQTAQASPTVTSGAAAAFDYDGDGRMDVIEAIGTPMRVQLMHNQGPQAHWLEVKLHGRAPNVDGIGATVTLTQSGRPPVSRYVVRSRGSVGSSWPVAHFGLGARTDTTALTIAWPDGTRQTVPSPAPDQLLVVTEPSN